MSQYGSTILDLSEENKENIPIGMHIRPSAANARDATEPEVNFVSFSAPQKITN